jgi:peptide/nickel transport system ATP-binding protein
MSTAARPHPLPDLLAIEDLRVSFPAGPGAGEVAAVRGVSFALGRGEIVGLLGESGSGKSLTALSILRLTPAAARVEGRVLLDGEDLLTLSPARLREVRGGRVGMVFQEPASALDPVLPIGRQVAEAIRAHRRLSRRAALDEAVELLARVALPEPGRRLRDVPSQLSGGQRQRVMIALALAAGPDLLIADEPTTALDVTLQAQILALLRRLRDELGLAVLLITHDLGVVAETCDRAIVMYAGEVVEEGGTAELLASPAHPYTRGLLASLPTLGAARRRLPAIPGQPPAPGEMVAGCAFTPRCAAAFAPCAGRHPDLYRVASGRLASGDPVASGGSERRARCFLHGGAA